MTNAPHTVLVVEDDPNTREFLIHNLGADGYRVHAVENVNEASRALEARQPDVALIELYLPDGSGLELVSQVRQSDGVSSRVDPTTPLVVLSKDAGEIERVRAFERGCDDFVNKPFSYPELRLRIQALLRRSCDRVNSGSVRVGELELDPVSRDVRMGGKRVDLSQKEFALLHALAAEPTRVFTKAELLRDVWGFRSIGATRTLDSHICRLRQKLCVSSGKFVVTVWGVGYRLLELPRQLVNSQDRSTEPLLSVVDQESGLSERRRVRQHSRSRKHLSSRKRATRKAALRSPTAA